MTLVAEHNLEQFFENKGVDQKSLAQFIPCSSAHISDLKRGKKRISMRIANRIEYFTEGDVKIADWAQEVDDE